MNKKDVCKLYPGTWILVGWTDSDPEIALLLEKPQRQNGDVCFDVFLPDSENHIDTITHTQVLDIVSFNLDVPDVFRHPDVVNSTRLKGNY